MIIKGLANIRAFLHSEHMKNRQEYYQRNPPRRAWKYRGPSGHNDVSDHDEDYVVDALFDIPNR